MIICVASEDKEHLRLYGAVHSHYDVGEHTIGLVMDPIPSFDTCYNGKLCDYPKIPMNIVLEITEHIYRTFWDGVHGDPKAEFYAGLNYIEYLRKLGYV